MNGTINATWKLHLGYSAAIHAAVIILCMAVIGNAAGAKRDIITIVLDGQASFTPGPRYDAAPQKQAQKLPRTKPLQEPAAREAPKVVRHEVISQQAEPVVTPTNPQSQVAAAVDAPVAVNTAEISAPESKAHNSGYAADQESVHAGNGGSNKGASDQAGAVYMREHFFYIRDLITKNLVYPYAAKKFGWKGSLTVSFVICEGGRVENIRIVKSSGYKILDDNAVNTIKSIQPFPRPPAKAEIVIPIEYRFG